MLCPAPKNDSVSQTRVSVTSNTLQHLSVGFSIALPRRERQRSLSSMKRSRQLTGLLQSLHWSRSSCGSFFRQPAPSSAHQHPHQIIEQRSGQDGDDTHQHRDRLF